MYSQYLYPSNTSSLSLPLIKDTFPKSQVFFCRFWFTTHVVESDIAKRILSSCLCNNYIHNDYDGDETNDFVNATFNVGNGLCQQYSFDTTTSTTIQPVFRISHETEESDNRWSPSEFSFVSLFPVEQNASFVNAFAWLCLKESKASLGLSTPKRINHRIQSRRS